MSDPFDIFEKLTDLYPYWQDALLMEGVRADTIRDAYKDKIPEKDLKTLEDQDPTEGKKYFAWMAKQYMANPNNILVITNTINRFEELKLHQIIKGETSSFFG